jgi:hypothetical protein
MCWYRHTTYRCGHPAPDQFASPCDRYPTCNARNFVQGTFRRREMCPECIYDAEKKSSSSRSRSSRSGR